MPKNFGEFTQEGNPQTGQFVVGYNTAAADGERRFAIGDISGAILEDGAPTALSGVTGNEGVWELNGFNNLLSISGSGDVYTIVDSSTSRVAVGYTGNPNPIGGSEPQFQFNSGNTLQGASGLTYDYANDRVAVGGTFTPDHHLHVSGAGPTDTESGVMQSNFGVQVGTGAWDTGDYLFMASGTGVFINYYTLPSSDPNNRGQLFRQGTALHVSAG
tara:strand:- start:2124 stop:2771 length:648 start_codon:yes stop_codon:yes gene_type:complete